jgi:hypothetical protein
MSIFFNKAMFNLKVQTLRLLVSRSNDPATLKELDDATNLESLPRKRMRQVVRNVDKSLELFSKLAEAIPDLQAMVNREGKTMTFTIGLDGTITAKEA